MSMNGVNENTIVIIRSFPDRTSNAINWSKICTLGESLKLIKEREHQTIGNGLICSYSVCIDLEVLYEYENDKVRINEDYQDILNFDKEDIYDEAAEFKRLYGCTWEEWCNKSSK